MRLCTLHSFMQSYGHRKAISVLPPVPWNKIMIPLQSFKSLWDAMYRMHTSMNRKATHSYMGVGEKTKAYIYEQKNDTQLYGLEVEDQTKTIVGAPWSCLGSPRSQAVAQNDHLLGHAITATV